MDTLSYKTISSNKNTVKRSWFIVDAEDQIVGRLSTRIAQILRGKHKASFTPHFDAGDYVIVINSDKVRFTGNKFIEKEYLTYSGYPGGQKSATPKSLLARKPNYVIEHAVRGMLPKNKLGRVMIKKLFVYAGTEHPHQAQKPQTLNVSQ